MLRRHQGNKHRGAQGHGDVGEEKIGGEEADIASQHGRDGHGSRGRGNEQAQAHALRKHRVNGGKQQPGQHAARPLNAQQCEMQRVKAEVARFQAAERKEKHGKKHPGGQKGELRKKGMPQNAQDNGQGQGPAAEQGKDIFHVGGSEGRVTVSGFLRRCQRNRKKPAPTVPQACLAGKGAKEKPRASGCSCISMAKVSRRENHRVASNE